MLSLKNFTFKKIIAADNAFLTAQFSEVEIKSAVWDCEDSKSLRSDRITFEFINEFWEVIKGDCLRFVSESQDNGRIAKGVNSSFIVLVPKRTTLLI